MHEERCSYASSTTCEALRVDLNTLREVALREGEANAEARRALREHYLARLPCARVPGRRF